MVDRAEEQNSVETIPSDLRIDLRGIPPTKAWLQLRSSGAQSSEQLRARLSARLQGAVLDLGRQDLSWSAESLWAVGGALDRLLSHLLSLADTESGIGGSSTLSSEILRDRKIRAEARAIQRVLYLKAKALKEQSK